MINELTGSCQVLITGRGNSSWGSDTRAVGQVIIVVDELITSCEVLVSRGRWSGYY
jgi:hypothetical protein